MVINTTLQSLVLIIMIGINSGGAPLPETDANKIAINTYLTEQTIGMDKANAEQVKVSKALELLREVYPDWRHIYRLNEFDCSEMAAFVKWYLDSCGISTHYRVGYNLYHLNIGHIWLTTESGICVDGTTLTVMPPAHYDYYDIQYDFDELKNADALKNSEAFDWWATIPAPDKKNKEVNK